MARQEKDDPGRFEIKVPLGKQARQLEFPQDVIPKKNRIKYIARTSVIIADRVFVLASVLGLAAFGGYTILKNVYDDALNEYDPILPPHREKSIEGLESYYGIDGNQIDGEWRNVFINEYKVAKASFTGFGNYDLKTNYSEDTLNFVREGRESLLVDGVNFLNRIEEREVFEIDENEGFIRYNDANLVFKFGNTYQEFLAGAIMDQLMELDLPDGGNKDARAYLDDLVWLSRQNLPIEFTPDSYSFPDTRILINTARFYRTLIELGYPLPGKIIFVPYSEGDRASAWYVNQDGDVIVTERAGAEAIVHEEAHNQATNNEKFNQDAFNKMFLKAIAEQELGHRDPNVYISDYPLSKEDDESVLVENYAEVIEAYFTDGSNFRTKLKEIFYKDRDAYNVLQAQYDFAKEFFGDREYLQDGEVFAPEIGNTFIIEDPDLSGSGIYLREKPQAESTGPLVFQGDSVKILEGPQEMYLQSTDKVETVWKVERVVSESLEGTGDIGWIREFWFGVKIIEDQ